MSWTRRCEIWTDTERLSSEVTSFFKMSVSVSRKRKHVVFCHSLLHQILSEPSFVQPNDQLQVRVIPEIERWLESRPRAVYAPMEEWLSSYDWIGVHTRVLEMTVRDHPEAWSYKVFLILQLIAYSPEYREHLLRRESYEKTEWFTRELKALFSLWRRGLSLRVPRMPWEAELGEEELTRVIPARELTVVRLVQHIQSLWARH